MPRRLTDLPSVIVAESSDIDTATAAAQRVLVLGTHADLAAVLTRLLRTERLDVEVAHLPGRFGVGRALSGPARRVPLIRDETGSVICGSARWLPPQGSESLLGEAVVDDAVLFDGPAPGVLIEPTIQLPGLRAAVLSGGRKRWYPGRAAQLGTAGAVVVRDGVRAEREVRRCTFYRHTQGWLRVG